MTKRIALLVGVLALAFPAIAIARTVDNASVAQNATPTLHLTYRVLVSSLRGLITQSGRDLVGNGRYVGYLRPTLHPLGEQFVLVDDKTGKRIVARWPSFRFGRSGYVEVCDPTLGDTWLGFDCPGWFRFYNLRTGKWRKVGCDATCASAQEAQLWAVGAKWFVVMTSTTTPDCHGEFHTYCVSTSYLYYNIATGIQGFPQVDAHTIIDLNSPNLTSPLCPPLQAPLLDVGGYLTAFPPSLTFFGRFAVSQETSGFYLEECGSQLHMPLGGNGNLFFGGSQAVAFGNADGQGSGFFLPSLQGFTFNSPAGFDRAVLGPRHLYVLSQWSPSTSGHLWVAAFPSKPPASSS